MRMRLSVLALASSSALAAGLLVGATGSAVAEPGYTEPRSTVPLPTVERLPDGPIFTGALQNLEPRGYLEREYTVTVTNPQVYTYVGESTRVRTSAAPKSALGDYRSRIIVRAPENAADFNGRVLVEMMNTTALVDLDIAWQQAHDYLMRDGWAYVGITVQQTGLNALANFTRDKDRYTSLGLNLLTPRAAKDRATGSRDPSIAWDLTSQVGALVARGGATSPLDGYAVDSLYLTGQSQMAGYAVTYINAIHPRHRVYDGFLVASRGAGATNLRYVPPVEGATPSTSASIAQRRISARGAPVISLQSESDPLRAPAQGEVKDFRASLWRVDANDPTDRFRLWEVAGSSHNDRWGSEQALGILRRDAFLPFAPTCNWVDPAGVNDFPARYTWHAALDGLARWHEESVPPTSAPRVSRAADGSIKRDPAGNALGGIRLPRIDVPVATFTPTSAGGLFCPLTGTQSPFAEATLGSLYPTLDDYVRAVESSAGRSVASGFLLQEDAAALVESARRGPAADAATIREY